MKKLILMFLIIVSFTVISYSKYMQEYELEAIEIVTDMDSPTYSVSYSDKNFTNKDVEIKISFSEGIQELQGFEKVDEFIYKKILKQNKSEKIDVFDLVGNKTEVKYSVTCIDKISPEIIGINNNETYYETKKVQYKDNLSGIKSVEKVFFGDLEIGVSNFTKSENYYEIKVELLRKPKNCSKFKSYKISGNAKQVSDMNDGFITYRIPINENFEIYAQAIDSDNKVYISEKININNINEFIEKNKKYNSEDLYTFSNPGYYDLKVTDNANNEIFYTIKIEK